MRVLVTGGAGFIGSEIVRQLAAADMEVVHLDRANGTGDLRDPAVVARAVRGVDAVCHQAARVGLGVDFDDVTSYVDDNDVGTGVLLRALWNDGFRGRLVLASSMVVYGEGHYRCESHGVVDAPPRREADLRAGRFEPRCPSCDAELEPEAVTEDAAVDPRNTYAATKLHQEHLCFAYGREADVAVTALRYHNVYGPGLPRDTPYAGVAAIFTSALEAGRAPELFEDGRQRRDFVHVADVARANVHALTTPEPAVGPFNVASGCTRTVADLATALVAAYGSDAPSPVATGRYRLGDVRHVFASPMRAERVLGFRASVPFEKGVAELARSGPPR